MFAADFRLRRTAECHQERRPPQTGERGCGEMIAVREQCGGSQTHIRLVLISLGLQAICVFIVIVNNKKQLQINRKSCVNRARRMERYHGRQRTVCAVRFGDSQPHSSALCTADDSPLNGARVTLTCLAECPLGLIEIIIGQNNILEAASSSPLSTVDLIYTCLRQPWAAPRKNRFHK